MPISISQVISVVLALAVVYYVLGLIVSAITKYILEVLNTRGKSLEGFLKENGLGIATQGKSALLDQLKKMPQLDTLKPVRYTKSFGFFPSGFFTGKTEIIDYVERIPPKNLVDALFDLPGATGSAKKKAIAIIDQLPNQIPGPNGSVNFEAKKQLMAFVGGKFKDLDELRTKMETWFSGLMDQAAQEFKAKARFWVVLISFIVTLILGVDSIDLAQKYWNNATIAATADAQARLILGSTDEDNQKNADIEKLTAQLEEMQAIDFEWYQVPKGKPWYWLFGDMWKKLPGLLITAFAVSQGSSFWYDIIRRIKGEQAPASSTSTADASGAKAA